MNFIQNGAIEKTILVISDFHLGAGQEVNNRKNFLEDFHFDRELVEFLDYYCSGEYSLREVELIINGDFFDFLAVPFVEYFDDEFWSEKASLAKLKLILQSHRSVMESMDKFLSTPKKKITYILGNHDAELVLPIVQDYLLNSFPPEARKNFFLLVGVEEYIPEPGVLIKHGHQYERAHNYDPKGDILYSTSGEAYLLPPWGSFYVTRVINKFKEQRSYINSVRPIKSFLIYSLIFDTFFTLRFIFANISYFFMVRFMHFFKIRKGLKNLFQEIKKELELFRPLERASFEKFHRGDGMEVLIVGHTHQPEFRTYVDGTTFINTGTWTKMINLELPKMTQGFQLTYAEVQVRDVKQLKEGQQKLIPKLLLWKGLRNRPFKEYY